jgi:HAD superfamily phosphoserine phosphatase-like hydrolase
MSNASTGKARDFVESVLRLNPELAVFDCDGTLWPRDAGEEFFDWELKRGLLSDEIARWARARYADYKAGKVDEDTMCGEMVTIHRGLPESRVQQAATEFFDANFVSDIFPEMRDLIRKLSASGCEVWAVSSTNEWVIRAAIKHFGIEQSKILAAAAQIHDGYVSDRLVRVPSGHGKAKAIQEVIGRDPDVAFGNSRWDREMLALARHGFAVNPNDDLQKIARECNWPIYQPNGAGRK